MERLSSAPEIVVYLVLGAAATLENLVPPIPADVVILFGGLLAGRGVARVDLVFLSVWICNVAGALAVYLVGRRFGASFFEGRWGRLLLQPRQVARLNVFYRRYGFGVIFVSRFLPMFRAVVPVFAGVAQVGFFRAALPIAVASALWYGLIVWLGATAGRNWEEIVAVLDSAGRWLWVLAGLVAAAVGWWWWRTRSEPDDEHD